MPKETINPICARLFEQNRHSSVRDESDSFLFPVESQANYTNNLRRSSTCDSADLPELVEREAALNTREVNKLTTRCL